MLIIIDGYNILKQRSGILEKSGYILQEKIDKFLQQVNIYVRKKGHTAIIVFDGGDSYSPEKMKHNNITVIYSGYRLKADDVIKRLCSQATIESVVISSDRLLCNYVARLGISCLDSLEFDKILKTANITNPSGLNIIKSNLKPIKLSQEDNQESNIDLLMEQASRIILDKDKKIDAQERDSNTDIATRKPKQNKKLKKLIKKL